MRASLRTLCLALIVLVATFQFANAQKITAIVAFGDTFSDLGNTYTKLGDWGAIGLADYNSYFYDNGRWSNGPIWLEEVNRQFGFIVLQRNDGTSLYGTDFAWGGSTTGIGYSWTVLANLKTQVFSYTNLLTLKYGRMPPISHTLFTIWSGATDVIYYVTGDEPGLQPQQVCDNIAFAITWIYNNGGRYFFVPNLPPLGDKPNFRPHPKYMQLANAFVASYNPLLKARLDLLQLTLIGITIIPFDVHTLFEQVLQDPAKYGLTNVTNTAFMSDSNEPHGGSEVNNPDQFLFWDGTHPTVVGHEIIADQAYLTIQKALGRKIAR
jgi:phospholipase/lecithinase/hemolysin